MYILYENIKWKHKSIKQNSVKFCVNVALYVEEN